MSFEDRYEPLLARRIPRGDVVQGRAYVIHARNGGVGVAVFEDNQLGYRLRREKFGDVFLFTEWDWHQGPPFGTAIPLAEIDEAVPDNDDELLEWLRAKEDEHRAETNAAWKTILGDAMP